MTPNAPGLPPLIQYGAELVGTFWLVLGGCGSAVFAAAFPTMTIGLLGVALAFGLTELTTAFAIGHISGCHLNPAVSLGLWAAGRFPAKELLPYIVAQVLGAWSLGVCCISLPAGGRGLIDPKDLPQTATAPIHWAGIVCRLP